MVSVSRCSINTNPIICGCSRCLFTTTEKPTYGDFSEELTLVAALQDIPSSQEIMVASGNQIAGNITMPGKLYAIRFAANNVYAIHQIDHSAFPED